MGLKQKKLEAEAKNKELDLAIEKEKSKTEQIKKDVQAGLQKKSEESVAIWKNKWLWAGVGLLVVSGVGFYLYKSSTEN